MEWEKFGVWIALQNIFWIGVRNALQTNWSAKYRVTIQVGTNLPLTSKRKFCFGLDEPGLVRPKRNVCFEVNGRFSPT